jgi:hypothetical protein
MKSNNYLKNEENEDKIIINRPELNTEEVFKTGEISFNVSEELKQDIFNTLNKNTNYSPGYLNNSIKAANNKFNNYYDEISPPQTIKEIEDKFKKINVECEYIYFDLTFCQFLNILKKITIHNSKPDKLSKISQLISYLESNEEIKREYLITANKLKQDILFLNEIEEGLVHYTFKIIETHLQCLN